MTMNRLPAVKIVRINRPSGPTMSVSGSFLDREYVFHLIRDGQWHFRLGPLVYDVAPGQLVLLPPGLLHTVHPKVTGQGEQWVIHFELHEPWPMLKEAAYVVTPDAPTLAEIAHAYDRLLDEFQHPRAMSQWRLAGLTTDILALYLRAAGTPASGDPRPMPHWASIEKAMRLVQKQYADFSLQVQDLVQASGLSETHFVRLFKDYTGQTPKQYIDHLRLRQAQQHLLEGTFNCTQIALRTGYGSLHVFSKTFKRLLGVSPKTWLKQATG